MCNAGVPSLTARQFVQQRLPKSPRPLNPQPMQEGRPSARRAATPHAQPFLELDGKPLTELIKDFVSTLDDPTLV
jgi:hypothetical protein